MTCDAVAKKETPDLVINGKSKFKIERRNCERYLVGPNTMTALADSHGGDPQQPKHHQRIKKHQKKQLMLFHGYF